MSEVLLPVTNGTNSRSNNEAMSLATQSGFEVSGLIAIVIDGPSRTLGVYNDGVKGVYYREKRADGIMRGGMGIPNLSMIVSDKIKALLPKEDIVEVAGSANDRSFLDPTLSPDGEIHVLPTPAFPVYGDLGREGTRRVPTGDGRDGSLRVGPGGI